MVMDREHGQEAETRVTGRGPIHVLIADPSALVRAGLRSFLDVDGFDVVGEAASGPEAIELAALRAPDVVLMDVQLSRAATATVRGIRAASPATTVVVLAGSLEPSDVVDLLDAGASGYVLKEQGKAQLIAAVQLAGTGGVFLAPQAMDALMGPARRRTDGLLTSRELEIVGLVADGLPNKQIARYLGISERTVKAHLGSAFKKIGVTRRVEAALWAHARRDDKPV